MQEDIERADAKARLAAILNRDLIRPWIDLEFGPQKAYPRLRIARPDEEDLGSSPTRSPSWCRSASASRRARCGTSMGSPIRRMGRRF